MLPAQPLLQSQLQTLLLRVPPLPSSVPSHLLRGHLLLPAQLLPPSLLPVPALPARVLPPCLLRPNLGPRALLLTWHIANSFQGHADYHLKFL